MESMSIRSSRYLPRVLLILPVFVPSATIYIIKPLSELARQKRLVFDRILESEASVAQIRASDLVLFCRNSEPSSDWILNECLSQNIPTVYDLDDNFWEVPLDLYYARHHRAPERLQQLERFLSSVNVVRVYSRRMLEKVSRFNRHAVLVRPCIDMSLVPSQPLPRKDDLTRLTYVTGRGGGDALISVFGDDLLKLFDTYPNQVEMYWWGEIPEQFKDRPGMRMINIIHDYDEFIRYLANFGFDIGLAPLTPSNFNLSKTNTKFRDYGASRIPGIYTNVEVYEDVEHERTGLLVDNQPGSWYEAMSRLVTDRQLRSAIAERAYQYVYENYRQQIVESQWVELIDTLLSASGRLQTGVKVPGVKVEREALRVSLGCQAPTPAGFVGVAGRLAPGVQVIADLDAPLPLASGSAQLLLADHALDEIQNPDGLLKEIYRISQHGAQVCISAAYTGPDWPSGRESKGNAFNEAAPRQWSRTVPPVYHADSAEADEGAPAWGSALAEEIDLRCVRMEFFYQPDYLNLRAEQKVKLRRTSPKVCDQVLYQAIVIKQPLQDEEFETLAGRTAFFEPEHITQRRQADYAESLRLELEQMRRDSQSWQADVRKAQSERDQLSAVLQATQNELSARLAEIEAKNSQFNRYALLSRIAARDLDAFRNRKIFRLIDRMFNRSDASVDLAPMLHEMRDDSLLFAPNLEGYLLQESVNLQRIPYLSYSMELKHPNLCEICLAPVLDVFAQSGVLGVEIVSPQNKIVAQATAAADKIEVNIPVQFHFDPIPDSEAGKFTLRVFARDLDVPLRVYEWRKYLPLGAGTVKVQPFCGFGFRLPG